MSDELSEVVSPTRPGAPIFSILGLVFAVFCFTTPLILVTLPLMLAAAMAIVGLVRRECPKWLAWIALGMVVLVFFAAGSRMSSVSGTSQADLSAAKLEDWSWNADPDFGTNGTIKWRAVVRNTSDRAMRNVKVEFSTYDKAGKLLASTFSYVEAIPPGETRTDESFADLYGNEDNARAVVSEVHFSGE